MPALENALIIFARAVRPGKVKTRLSPAFSEQEAAEIHAALVGDVIEEAVAALSGRATVTLAWSEPGQKASDVIPSAPAGIDEEVQPGGDLGERMALTIQGKLREGFQRVVILGSDAPTLPADHLTAAFEALDRSEVVLGPATDGGYYLVGMSRLHLEIFHHIQWGTPEVMAVTRRRLKDAGARFKELGPWRDVDTPEDLAHLWKEILHLKGTHQGRVPRRCYETLARLVPGRLPQS